MRVAGIIVAAGHGSRAGKEIPKQYNMLLGRPVLAWSVEAFHLAKISPLIVVHAPAHADLIVAALRGAPPYRPVLGGANRTASVRAGLASLKADRPDAVLIHDAARPGVSDAAIRAVVDALAAGAHGAAPALPVADALRRVGADGFGAEPVARTGLVRVQTPQGFRMGVIEAAYEALAPDAAYDDDLEVARVAGARVRIVPGAVELAKLTYAEDFAMLERLLHKPRATCVGMGFDAHRFGAGDHVMLCGVRIAHDRGLIGHSDADAGWHALVDAILGALGAGDIGEHFPPSDARWKGASSAVFLKRASELVSAAQARIVHIDITLVCERPKISPHREAMRARTAEALGVPLARVSVKATTTEKLGFLGREEGLAAQAVATLDRPL